MRILWVKIGGLWPINAGGRLRSFHILRELSRRNRVTVLTTHAPGDGPGPTAVHLGDCEEVVSIPHAIAKYGSLRFAGAVMRSWLSTYPIDLWKCRVPALREEVQRRLDAGTVDLCVADFLDATVNVPLDGPVPVVLFAHNVEHIIWRRLSQTEPRWWRRRLLHLEWRKMRRAETRACGRVAVTIAVSNVDQALLTAAAPRARVCVVPTGVDTAYFAPNGASERPLTLVFTGSMDWYPNEDAILYFIDAILPRIRREVPEVTMSVVGRDPTPRLRVAGAAAGVAVAGTVDDIRPYIAEAAVYVVPLRVGGGTRLKIFEALAMGKAVVSTTIGAEGLPLIPGKHFLSADDPDDFAAAVVSLLKDPARRVTLGEAARKLVEERYDWGQVAREFEARCEEALSRAR